VKRLWFEEPWEDCVFWQQSDAAALEKINDLLKDISRSPFKGLGKPEPLKRNLAGWWSRRITGEHRLVYRVLGKPGEQVAEIVQCRFHY
jgi:toxin YoeB